MDGVNRFIRYYFQLGFLPKKQYFEKLRMSPHSCNLFLLLSILSVSARMTPALRSRYGTGVKAAEFFMERASAIAQEQVYAEPSLERCQAFYLLSIAQHGSGWRNHSYVSCPKRPLRLARKSSHDTDEHGCRYPHGYSHDAASRRDI